MAIKRYLLIVAIFLTLTAYTKRGSVKRPHLPDDKLSQTKRPIDLKLENLLAKEIGSESSLNAPSVEALSCNDGKSLKLQSEHDAKTYWELPQALGKPDQSIDSYITIMLERLSRYDDKLSEDLKDRMSAVRAKIKEIKAPDGLRAVDTSRYSPLPKGCERKQLSITETARFDPRKGFSAGPSILVDQDLWKKLDNKQKATAIVTLALQSDVPWEKEYTAGDKRIGSQYFVSHLATDISAKKLAAMYEDLDLKSSRIKIGDQIFPMIEAVSQFHENGTPRTINTGAKISTHKIGDKDYEVGGTLDFSNNGKILSATKAQLTDPKIPSKLEGIVIDWALGPASFDSTGNLERARTFTNTGVPLAGKIMQENATFKHNNSTYEFEKDSSLTLDKNGKLKRIYGLKFQKPNWNSKIAKLIDHWEPIDVEFKEDENAIDKSIVTVISNSIKGKINGGKETKKKVNPKMDVYGGTVEFYPDGKVKSVDRVSFSPNLKTKAARTRWGRKLYEPIVETVSADRIFGRATWDKDGTLNIATNGRSYGTVKSAYGEHILVDYLRVNDSYKFQLPIDDPIEFKFRKDGTLESASGYLISRRRKGEASYWRIHHAHSPRYHQFAKTKGESTKPGVIYFDKSGKMTKEAVNFE